MTCDSFMRMTKLITFFLVIFFFCYSAFADTFTSTTIETEIPEGSVCPDTTYLVYDEATDLCVCIDDYETTYEADGAIVCTRSTFNSETAVTDVEEILIETDPTLNAYLSGGALMTCSFNPGSRLARNFPLFVLLFAFSIPLFLLRFSRG